MFKEPKEIIIKELKEGMVTISHQIVSIKREMVNNQVEIMELKSTKAEMKKI